MADQNITALPVAAAPASSDQLLLVGATEEKLIDYDKLADAILQKLTSKTFTLDQGVITLLKALNELNSNPLSTLTRSAILLEQAFDYNELKTTGVYYLTGAEASASANRPDDNCTNCFLLILAPMNMGRRATQIVFPGNHPYILYRSLNTDTDTWNEWKTIK